MGRQIHIEIEADDVDRAQQFHETHAVAGVGYLAYLRDTGGIRGGLLLGDASAT